MLQLPRHLRQRPGHFLRPDPHLLRLRMSARLLTLFRVLMRLPPHLLRRSAHRQRSRRHLPRPCRRMSPRRPRWSLHLLRLPLRLSQRDRRHKLENCRRRPLPRLHPLKKSAHLQPLLPRPLRLPARLRHLSAHPLQNPTTSVWTGSPGILVSFIVLVLLIGALTPLFNRWRKRKLLEQRRGQNLSFSHRASSDPGTSDKPEVRKAA